MSSIDLEDMKMMFKAGIILGQANPEKDVDKLVEVLVTEFIKQKL